jgi:hypothetical protein
MRIPLLESDLFRLAKVLEQHQLTPEHINITNTVVFALPGFALVDTEPNAIVLILAPLAAPPTETAKDLYLNDSGVAIGALKALRPLPFSDKQISALPPDVYLVKVRRGQIVFVNSQGEELAPPSLKAVVRTLQRDVIQPEASLTLDDIGYSWHHVQVSTEPVPRRALSDTEWNKLLGAMESAVNVLAAKGLVKPQDINVAGTVPGSLLNGKSPLVNFLAAPVAKHAFTAKTNPPDGALLGAGNMLVPLPDPASNQGRSGPCVVRAIRDGDKGVLARLEWLDGSPTNLPAEIVDLRGGFPGEQEESLIILDDFCFRVCDPFTQECYTVCIPEVNLF